MNAGDVMLLIAALALLVLSGVMTWVCVLPPRRDYSADDLEIAQQLELEGRSGDAAEVA